MFLTLMLMRVRVKTVTRYIDAEDVVGSTITVEAKSIKIILVPKNTQNLDLKANIGVAMKNMMN